MLKVAPLETVPFSEFEADCLAQDVNVDEEIMDAGREGISWSLSQNCYTPNAYFTAIAVASLALRTGTLALADIEVELEPEKYANNVPAQALASIINTSIKSHYIAGRTFRSDEGGIDTCSIAEADFSVTFADLLFDDDDIRARGQLIMDDKTPLFLRKSRNLPSSLALSEFSVDGVIYPAGTIARVEVEQDRMAPDSAQFYTCVPANRWEKLTVDDVVHIAPMRLSGFVLPPEQRSDVFHECDYIMTPVEREIFDHFPLDELARQSAQVATRSLHRFQTTTYE